MTQPGICVTAPHHPEALGRIRCYRVSMTPRVMLQPGETGRIRTARTADALTRAKAASDEAAEARARAWMERGTWVADTRYRDTFGKRVQVRRFGRTERDAREAVIAEVARRQEAGGTTLDGAQSVSQLVAWWEREMLPLKQVREQSRSKDKQIVRFITDRIGDLRLFEVTIPRAQLLLDTLAREGFRDRPKKVRNLAQQIWHDALVRQAVSSNPWMQTKTPPRTVVRTKDRALSDLKVVEVRRIVAEWCAPASDGAARLGPRRGKHLLLALDLMAVTGLRIGEVLALRACDVTRNHEDGSAIISVTGTIISGDTGISRQEDPKTATSNARITIPPFVAKRLVEHGTGRSGQELIFQSRNGRPVAPSQIATQLRAALAGTGFEATTPHSFRASLGSWVAAKFGDEAAREILRHASVETTRKHYIAREAALVDPAITTAVASGFLLNDEAVAWAEAQERARRAPDPEPTQEPFPADIF